jgi:hypothetical protein
MSAFWKWTVIQRTGYFQGFLLVKTPANSLLLRASTLNGGNNKFAICLSRTNIVRQRGDN